MIIVLQDIVKNAVGDGDSWLESKGHVLLSQLNLKNGNVGMGENDYNLSGDGRFPTNHSPFKDLNTVDMNELSMNISGEAKNFHGYHLRELFSSKPELAEFVHLEIEAMKLDIELHHLAQVKK